MHGATQEDRLREALRTFPRVRLARLPTPLEEAPRLSARLGGPRILLKREDLAGVGTGGSKYRILEFTLARASQERADILVAGGLAQSNHPQQVAAAAARLGLPVILVLGGPEPFVWQGNVLLEHLCGADVRWLPGADLDGVRRHQEAVVEELRTRGKCPAIVTLTREVYVLSVLAYANFALELAEQLEDAGETADAVYVGSGGGTYAGMLLGALALGRPFRVVGLTPTGSAASRSRYIAELVREALTLLGLDLVFTGKEVDVSDAYLGEGHGLPTKASVDAIRLMASTEGIFLDPVYTGKAMAGLVDHAQSGRLVGKTVVFVHTGGIPALFAYNAVFAPGSLRPDAPQEALP